MKIQNGNFDRRTLMYHTDGTGWKNWRNTIAETSDFVKGKLLHEELNLNFIENLRLITTIVEDQGIENHNEKC